MNSTIIPHYTAQHPHNSITKLSLLEQFTHKAKDQHKNPSKVKQKPEKFLTQNMSKHKKFFFAETQTVHVE